MKDVFGDATTDTERPIHMAVAGTALNSVEMTLLGQLAGVVECAGTPPIPFIEEDDDNDDFDGLPLSTVLALRDMLMMDAESVLRKQVVIAREMGPGGSVNEYEIACAAESVPPWPVGK
jgi:hypothetical protein